MGKKHSIDKSIFLNYIELGISVIPCNKYKRSLVKWEDFQRRLPTKEDIDQWYTSFDDIEAIAMVTGTISNICIIDLDFPILKDNMYYNSFLSLRESVDTFPEKLVSKTPRGGSHFWYKTPEKCPNNTVNLYPKIDFRGEGGYALIPPSVAWDTDLIKVHEFKEGKYTFETDFTSLKDVIKTLDILPEKVQNLLSTSSYQGVHKVSTLSTSVYNYFQDGQRDNDLFKIAMSLADGKCSESLMREALQRLAMSCNFEEKEAQAKVDSAMKRFFKKVNNLSQEVRDWALSTSGYFLSTDVHNCLQLSTREDKKNVSTILGRLADEGILEKDKAKNGKWRRLEVDEEIINLDEPEKPKKDIWLPFNLSELCYLHPKNLMIIAGVSETGKTAWMLNIARANCHKHNVYYFSSEMGATELKARLSQFECGVDGFKKVKFINRSSNFEDLIRPDDINIIDFLEIHEEHYKIGTILTKIYQKLNKGIAIIGIQKDAKKEFGVGGNVTQEKARIYLNLDHNFQKKCSTASIVKGKNWTNVMVNPRHRKVDYKLLRGAKLIGASDWYLDNSTEELSAKERVPWEGGV